MRDTAIRLMLFCFCLINANKLYASSSDCETSKDLSATLGPAQDQGSDVSSCFAFTAADQLTQKMHKKGLLDKNDRIHPFALWAIIFTQAGLNPNQSKNFLSTSPTVFNWLNKLRKTDPQMLCLQSAFGGSADGSVHFNSAERAMMAAFRKRLTVTSSGACTSAPPAVSLERHATELNEVAIEYWRGILREACKARIPELGWSWIWNADRYAALKENRIENWSTASNREISDKIDEALDSGSLAAIEYQSSFLMADGKPVMHWSSVVSREMRNGKCHYKIRNSRGQGCAIYKEPAKCQAGYIWVEKEELVRHVDAVNYLNIVNRTCHRMQGGPA